MYAARSCTSGAAKVVSAAIQRGSRAERGAFCHQPPLLRVVTDAHRCLATALGDLESKGLMGEHKVHVKAINPKVGIFEGTLCSKTP